MRSLALGLGTAVLSLGVINPVLPAAADEPVHRTSAAEAAPEESVGVTATVPTRATVRIAGARVSARSARPTVLQRRTASGWARVDARATRRNGAVEYRVTPAEAARTYRISAPAHRVRVARKLRGRTVAKRVTLPAWTGPLRIVAASTTTSSPPPGDPASPPAPSTQQTAQEPTQEPARQPSEEPTQQPGPTVALVPSIPASLAATMTDPAADASGRWIVFTSSAADLVPDDDNGQSDVFLLDTETGAVELVSRGLDGTPAAGSSYYPDLSADGQHVAFVSSAPDVVPAGNGGYPQVYVLDLATGHVDLVSKAPDGTPGDQTSSNPAISRNGRYVAYDSWAVNLMEILQYVDPTRNVFRHDRTTGLNEILTFPRGSWVGQSWWPSISDDGSRVTYLSQNESLVPEDGNGKTDVFLSDLGSRVRKMVSRRSDGGVLKSGSNQPVISGDGSAVVWSTDASGVVPGDDNESTDAFRYDVARRTNSLLSREPGGRPLDAVSAPWAVADHGSTALVASSWRAGEWGLVPYLADPATGSLAPLWTGPDSAPVMSRVATMSATADRILFVTSSALTADDRDQTDDLYVWERSG